MFEVDSLKSLLSARYFSLNCLLEKNVKDELIAQLEKQQDFKLELPCSRNPLNSDQSRSGVIYHISAKALPTDSVVQMPLDQGKSKSATIID